MVREGKDEGMKVRSIIFDDGKRFYGCLWSYIVREKEMDEGRKGAWRLNAHPLIT